MRQWRGRDVGSHSNSFTCLSKITSCNYPTLSIFKFLHLFEQDKIIQLSNSLNICADDITMSHMLNLYAENIPTNTFNFLVQDYCKYKKFFICSENIKIITLNSYQENAQIIKHFQFSLKNITTVHSSTFSQKMSPLPNTMTSNSD